ncbi:hypothetical protein HLB23_16745 [Nocardia uniformis]|uniref:Uncharacterized protein n=1 Tax=Nocardia uniformis TaxID=53432 RepID=A0A849BYA4_9NOCA|nr:hypothetical protein [Nocardia uniformis]NNH71492.1 hypothetical protein [Nocardia uniformis]
MTTTTTPTPTQRDTGPRFLRTALRVDGWGTGVFGVFLLATAPLLREPLGLPLPWSIPFGIAMLAGAAAILRIAVHAEIPTRFVNTVVAVNAMSALAMVVLVFATVIPLTAWGIAFMLTGAAVVAVFATLEYVGLRRQNR